MSGSGFERISMQLWCERGVGNYENERCPDPVLSGFLYSFGAKQVSKMDDFRFKFGKDFYITLVRNKCREL